MKGVVALAAFVCTLPYMAGAQVVISEVMYDPPGSDVGREWFEIYNAGPPVDISKWKVNDGSNHPLNLPPKNGSIGSPILAPHSYLVLAADAAAFRASHPAVTGSIIDTTMNLSNIEGTIALLDASGTVMESIQYSSALGAAGTGDSLQRMSLAQGTSFAAGPATPNQPPPRSGLVATPPPQKVLKQPKKSASTLALAKASAKSAKEIPVTADSVPHQSQGHGDPVRDSPLSMQGASVGSIVSGGDLWWLGAFALAGLVGVGIFSSSYFKKSEWDIVEETGE